MSDFFKRFLREDSRKLGLGADRAVLLGAFGKHPGWDDHIEEDERAPNLGLRSESLHVAKTLLYVQGIGRCVDTGAWEKLAPGQRLAVFNHAFLWHTENQSLAGRFWSSSDGKGRTRYPMVLAAHAFGAPLSWVAGAVFPRLEKLREECVAVTSAAAVGARLDAARAQLQVALTATTGGDAVDRERLGRFVRHAQFGADRSGLLRILYQLQRQTAAYAPDRFHWRADHSARRSQDLRVPAAGSEPGEVFDAWTRLLRTRIDSAVPLLLLWPLEATWLDIVIGEPVPEQFHCLLVTSARMPCVSEVPFTLETGFTTQAHATLEALASGELAPAKPSTVKRWLGALFKAG